MVNIRYFSVTVTACIAGLKERQTLRFPIKTTGYRESRRSVTLCKLIQKDLEKVLKTSEFIGINLFPVSHRQLEAEFMAPESTFKQYYFEDPPQHVEMLEEKRSVTT